MEWFHRYVPSVDQWTEVAFRARTGDPGALDALVRVAYGPVRRLCSALVDDVAADDLAQDTFLGVAKGIRRFRGESSARTWVFSIAHHVCATELRSRTRHRDRVAQAAVVERTRVGAVPDRSEELALHDLLHHLEPDRRAAFTLTQLYGLSYEETATICGCAPGTVGSRVARARDDLVHLFGTEGQTLGRGSLPGGPPEQGQARRAHDR